MIRAEGLSYRVAGENLIADLSLALGAHEINAIIGPNGAGKSTLIKCLTGTVTDFAGRVFYDDADIRHLSRSEMAKRRAVLTQSNALNFPISVEEVVQMGRHPHRLHSTAQRDADIIAETLALVDCAGLRQRNLATLSGGELQRCHLARVLAQIWDAPNAYLFLDEPSSALDFRHQYVIFEKLRAAVSEKRLGICFITHDVRLVRKYADRVIALKAGRLAGQWKAEECLKHIPALFDVPPHFLAR